MNPIAPLAVHAIVDQQHNLNAAAFNHPSTWQAQSWLQWNFAHATLPLKCGARAFDAQSGAVVEMLPDESFCWVEPFMGFAQPGQENGQGQITLAPMPAAETMARWVIPRYRGQARGLRLLNTNPMPLLAQNLGVAPRAGCAMEGVQARIEYEDGGTPFEEEFFGLQVRYDGIPSYGAAGTLMQYNWGFERLFSFRAPRGQLSAMRSTGWEIVRSLRLNPAWGRVYAQVLQQLQQGFQGQMDAGYAQIEAAGRLSHQISANSDAFLASQEQGRQDAQRSDQARRASSASSNAYSTSDAFSDTMMGRETVEDVNDPSGYSQHSGYHDHIWTNPQGETVYSDDPSYDPNVGSTTQWTEARKKQVGDPW